MKAHEDAQKELADLRWLFGAIVTLAGRKPGDIVILDNLGGHKSAALRRIIKAAGARLWYLPPYLPGLNPIEQTFAKIKHWMPMTQKRTIEDTWRHISDPRRNHPAPRMLQPLRKRRILKI